MTQAPDRPIHRAARGAAARTRIVLVDDHPTIRDGLRLAFQRAGDFEIVGEAGRASDAIAVVDDVIPDVVVTDLRMPGQDGISLTAGLRARHPDLGIVILTMYAGDEYLFAALDAGASGFVGKHDPSEDVVAAARIAADTPTAFTARGLRDAMARRDKVPTTPKLSARERDVLDLLVDGRTAQQIGRRLHISESTVKTHIGNLHRKFGVGTRAQVVMAAVREGLVRGIPSKEWTIPEPTGE